MQKRLTIPSGALMLLLCACSHPPPLSVTLPDATSVDFAVEPVGPHVPAGPLSQGHTFGQTFIANHDGLTKIQVLVATYSAKLPGGELVIHLTAYPDKQHEIASVTIPVNTIRDNDYITLEFPPIKDSAGKSYYFYLESRNILPKYRLTVWRSTTPVYTRGRFYIDSRQQNQDLYFRVYYHTSGASSLENSLVTAKGEDRLYLIQHGKRRWIRDLQWLNANGYPQQAPIWLSPSQLHDIPVGSSILYIPRAKQVQIAVYTAVLFVFFFFSSRHEAWLQRWVERFTAALARTSVDYRAFLLAAFVLLMCMRAPFLFVHPRFWAEEGTTFFQYASTHSLIRDLFYLYPISGYFNLMANVGGLLSSFTARFLSIEYAPLATTIAAFLMPLFAIAIILYGKSRLFSSWWRAVGGCLIVLFAPTAIPEIWLTTLNSMSYLGLITFLLLFEQVSAWPPAFKWVARCMLVLAGLSGPYSIALLPLFLVSFFWYRERERKAQCMILGSCLLVQFGCVLYSKLAGGGLPFRGHAVAADILSVNVLFWHVAVPALGEHVAHALFGALGLAGAWLAASSFPHVWDASLTAAGILSLIILIGIFWSLLRRADANRIFVGAGFFTFAVLTSVASANAIPATRYAFLPGLAFLLLLLCSIESGALRLRSLICMLILSFALANGIVWYRMHPEPNEPIWSREVAKWRADHTYKLRIWPYWWSQSINWTPN